MQSRCRAVVHRGVLLAVGLFATAAQGAGGDVVGEPEFLREPSWASPTRTDVRDRLDRWLATADAAPAAAARAAWQAAGGDAAGDLLDATVAAIAARDPRVEELRRLVEGSDGPVAGIEWLADPAVAEFERDAVKLWLGRQLVRHARFDEALPLLAAADVDASVDPAGLLFHRAACQHWLLDVEAAAESLDRLLERAGAIPVRYERVARLLRADLAALEDESLDHVARRMRDITRRLDLGRAGPTTRRVQDGVIESLDRMIKELEDKQQDQSGGGGGGAGGAGDSQGSAGKPMDDSRPAGGKGKGDVTSRDIGSGDGWGNLPPQAREAALQQIGREFPPHYREAIEQYFKRLAAGGEEP